MELLGVPIRVWTQDEERKPAKETEREGPKRKEKTKQGWNHGSHRSIVL